MNRKDIINKLLSEGFSVSTLAPFNDKQLNSLYSRVIKEEETKTKISSKTPNLKTIVKDLKNQGIDDIEITEDEENVNIKKKSGIFAKKNLKEWVNNLVDSEYTSFTSKNEILEMISSKIQNEEETETINKIPEFMTYDSIKANAPTIAPSKPKTTPKVAPGQKPKTPYSPGPGKNPRPKAMGKSAESLKENKKTTRKK